VTGHRPPRTPIAGMPEHLNQFGVHGEERLVPRRDLAGAIPICAPFRRQSRPPTRSCTPASTTVRGGHPPFASVRRTRAGRGTRPRPVARSEVHRRRLAAHGREDRTPRTGARLLGAAPRVAKRKKGVHDHLRSRVELSPPTAPAGTSRRTQPPGQRQYAKYPILHATRPGTAPPGSLVLTSCAPLAPAPTRSVPRPGHTLGDGRRAPQTGDRDVPPVGSRLEAPGP
jgi:hypothetical protein